MRVGAASVAKVWNVLWNENVLATGDTYGWQNYTIRHLIDWGGFTGVRNGNAVRVTWLAGPTYGWGLANAFIGQGVRGTPNFAGTPTRLRFNGNNGVSPVPLNGSFTSDPVNFPFDPSQPLVIAQDLDGTSPGGFPYCQVGAANMPYVTMWYAAGAPDAANQNMKPPTGPYPGYIYGGVFMIEILGQPTDTYFVGPMVNEPQTFAGGTCRMFIPQSVLPKSGGNYMRLTLNPYISTGGYGISIVDMWIGYADQNWSRTNPSFASQPVQVKVNGNTSFDLFALAAPITTDPIPLPVPAYGGLCLAFDVGSAPLATGYMAGGPQQPYGGQTCYKSSVFEASAIGVSGYTPSAYNYCSWLYSRIEACTNSPPFSTSYSKVGGRGDRRSLITPATSFGITTTYPLTSIVDGNSWGGVGPLVNAANSSGYWMFDFQNIAAYIDEIAWFVGAATAAQTYALEGSNDTFNWDPIATIQINDMTPRKFASFVPQSSQRYRYFRMRLIAGVTQASYYNWEAEFKIDSSVPFSVNDKLLLHFDGADGDTTTTDSSPSNHPLTFTAPAVLKATQSRFGTTSLQCGLAGGNAHLTTPYSPDFDFGVNSDFTVEAWIYMTALPSPYSVIVGGNSVGWFVGIWPAPDWLRIWAAPIGYYSFGWPSSVDNGAPQTNKWYHVAVSRWNNVLYGFVNGIPCPNRWVTQYDFSLNAGNLLWIGGLASYNFVGYLDELCIRKDFAYNTGFTPQTGPYPG